MKTDWLSFLLGTLFGVELSIFIWVMNHYEKEICAWMDERTKAMEEYCKRRDR